MTFNPDEINNDSRENWALDPKNAGMESPAQIVEKAAVERAKEDAEFVNREKEKTRKEFQGEDAEVTVERSNGELEGGWEVDETQKVKEGKVFVRNSEKKIHKIIKREKLLKLQPFQKDEKISVIRSSGELDKDWVVLEKLGNGNFMVAKEIDGKSTTKFLKKSDLMNAKIAELNFDRGQIYWPGEQGNSRDYPVLTKIDKEIAYWQRKIDVAVRLDEESQKVEEMPTTDPGDDGDIEAVTPQA